MGDIFMNLQKITIGGKWSGRAFIRANYMDNEPLRKSDGASMALIT